MRLVLAILVLLGGLKLLSSTLLGSVLALRVDALDYRILPSLALALVAIPVLISKITADARSRTADVDREDDKGGRKLREVRHDD